MARAGGGGQLQEFTKEQSRLAIDQAGKEAQLQVVRRQLEEVQKRLAQVAPSAQHTDADAVNLGGQRSELMRKAQGLELDLAGLDAGRKALQEQIAAIRDEAGKRLGDDPVTRELQRLVALGEDRLARVQQSAAAGRASAGDVAEAQKNLAQVRIDLARRQEELRRQTSGGQLEEFVRELRHGAVERAQKAAQLGTVRRQLEQVQKRLAQVALVAPRTDADAVNLGGQRNDLTRRAQVLELDLAGIDARRKALQEQVVMIRDEAGKQLDTDVVTQELQQLLAVCEESLVQVRKAVEAERLLLGDVARAQENVARARIDLARRREELTRAAGGGLLEEFTRELSRLAIDKAQKEAQRQTVGRQLDEVQRQLVQTLVSDP
jgi:chromosome segregation ATPase